MLTLRCWCEPEQPSRGVVAVSAAALLRSLSVDPSWQVELAVSLACPERPVLPGYRDRLAADLPLGSFLARVGSWDLGGRCFARPVGLYSLFRLVAPLLAEFRLKLLPFQLLRTTYANLPGHRPSLPPGWRSRRSGFSLVSHLACLLTRSSIQQENLSNGRFPS
jgi:hypothetical protein